MNTQPHDDAYYETMGAAYQEMDDAYRATLTPEQLREYRRFNREIGDCPRCGAVDADLEQCEQPDMVGTTYWTHYMCCGYDGDSYNDALEYNADGKVVDVR